MAGLSVAWNIILAPPMLNEKLTQRDVQGTKWILAGCVFVGATGSHRTPHHSRDELFLLFQGNLFLVYYTFVLVLCGVVRLNSPDARSVLMYRVACGYNLHFTT